MNAYELLIPALNDANIDTVFTLMSEDVLQFVSEIEDSHGESFDVVHSRHEQGAAGMADGYYRATGEIGLCVVGRGPGIAQTGTAVTTARKNSSRVLYVVAGPPLSSTTDGKAFEQRSYLRDTVGDVVSIDSVDTMDSQFRTAIERVQSTGPIAVQIPMDVLNSTVEPEIRTVTDGAPSPVSAQRARLSPDADALAVALDHYLDADATTPPVILAGRGAVQSDAKAAIQALAERMNALLATTMKARGLFSEHPYSLGLVGSLGSTVANTYLGDAGFVLCVGTSLEHHTTDSGRLFRDDASVVQVDTDPGSLAETDSAVPVRGDAETTTRRFEDLLAEAGVDRTGTFWTDSVKADLASAQEPMTTNEPQDDRTCNPKTLLREIDDILPQDRVVVTDAGHFTTWVVDEISVPGPDHFVWTLDFVSIGLGLSMGIGAAVARQQPCITFCGDAGFLMGIQELETATRYDVPMIVFVMNDDALGAEYHQAVNAGFSGESATMATPDFETVARGFGATSYTVNSLEDLDAVATELEGGLTGPVVVDCQVTPDVKNRYYGG